MNGSSEQIHARIGKMTYQLTSSGDPQKMRDIAATADAMMTQVAKNNPQLNQVSQAVLALVNAVGMMQEAYEKAQSAYIERDVANDTAEGIKAELIRLREQFWQLKKELLYYRNLCEIYESKLTDRMREEMEEAGTQPRPRRARRTKVSERQMTFAETLPDEEGEDSDA
ncbi:MAG: hypothetical protein ACOYH4_05265 [Saccharofermentanales bacterium]